jgi:hypothetical protein
VSSRCKVKPDRFTLMLICEHGEREGFDPEQVQILRDHAFAICQPKIKDVVEMAMQLPQPRSSTFEAFYRDAINSDESVKYWMAECERIEGDPEIGLVAKLLEMTPERRDSVAERVRQKVREQERSYVEINGRRVNILPGSLQFNNRPQVATPDGAAQIRLTQPPPAGMNLGNNSMIAVSDELASGIEWDRELPEAPPVDLKDPNPHRRLVLVKDGDNYVWRYPSIVERP